MKVNQKGFSIVEVLIVLVVLGLLGGAGWYVWQSKDKAITSDTSIPNMPDFTSNIDAGTHSLTLKTSDRILMPSGAMLSLPELDANSVPEFSYDNTYKSNPSKRLAINSLLEVYHNGYKYKITKGNCNTAEKTFDDYTQVVVTDCKVSVDVQKSNLQTLSSADTTKQYTVSEKNNPRTGPQQTLSTDPFLLVKGGNGRLTYPINNGKPYLEANDGPSVSLTVISDYGVSNVSYNAEEFTAKTEKQVEIAGSTIKVKPSTITCTSAYMQNGKCAIINDKFVFDISYSRQSANNPEVIIYNLN